ncbi:hypothetical protein KR222_006009 [Zaprionus bogoriensis]|nr:hypothetical protein KR222_006009 [Zaprionus bogoriensis]
MCDTTASKCGFDFQSLVKTFSEICPDFAAEPSYTHATVSRRFAEQVIFDYSKQCKEAKAQGFDKTWRLTLDSKSDEGESLNHQVIISTYIVRKPPKLQPFLQHGCLYLTFKQASLLAVAKYCQIVPHLVKRHEIVLTPLAGAVFAKDEMPELAGALGEPLPQVLQAVISSCQTDGHYLEHSRCYLAIVALVKTVADEKLRAALVKSTIKNYQLQGKEFDMAKFKICCEYVQTSSSGTSSNSPSDNLISQIMAIDLSNESRCSSRGAKTPKQHMKCAAKFTGQNSKK